MTKRKAIVKFCVICVLTALGVSMIFANFRIPILWQGTYWNFKGFAGAIESRMGIDLRGGVLAIFDAETQEGGTPSGAMMDATVSRLNNSLRAAGLTEATVQIQGDSRIRVEVPGMDETEEIFRAIGNPSRLTFRDSSGNIYVEPRHISRVELHQNQDRTWGVLLTFNTEGGAKFRELVQKTGLNNQIFKYINDAPAPGGGGITVSSLEAGRNNTTVITIGGSGSISEAEAYQLQLQSGLFELRLSLSESSVIPETLGPGALRGSIIALIISLFFILIFMFLRYGDLGLLSNLSIVIYMVLFFFALAIINAVQLTLPGIAGIILALAMAVDANIIIFERMRDEYKTGKRMSIAVENGFKKSFWTIFDANITTIIGGVVLYFLGTGPIRGFAITLMLGVAISMFCSLVLTRSFAKLYLYINPTNAKRLKLVNNNPYITEVSPTKVKAPQKRALNLGDSK